MTVGNDLFSRFKYNSSITYRNTCFCFSVCAIFCVLVYVCVYVCLTSQVMSNESVSLSQRLRNNLMKWKRVGENKGEREREKKVMRMISLTNRTTEVDQLDIYNSTLRWPHLLCAPIAIFDLLLLATKYHAWLKHLDKGQTKKLTSERPTNGECSLSTMTHKTKSTNSANK